MATTEASEDGKPRLQLPASCDPPIGTNTTKQLVWIVSSPVIRRVDKQAGLCRLIIKTANR